MSSMPSVDVSRRSRRVSSAATMPAAASSPASRGEASDGSPIGVPASTSTPGRLSHPVILPGSRPNHGCMIVAMRGGPGPPAPYDDPVLMTARAKLARERLVRPMPSDILWGWVGPILIALFAGGLRFWRLGTPKSFVFDETYYAKDAFSLLKFGVEQNFVKGDDKTKDLANQRILAGDFNDVFAGSPSYVVHPPGGKWVIARRGVAVRDEPVRLALHGRADGHVVGADDRPHRPTAVPVDPARLPRRPAACRRRHALRAQPHRTARPDPDVLGARGVRGAADRPRPLAEAAGGPGRRRRHGSAPGWACDPGGSSPASASAWPAPPSGAGCGSSSSSG